MLAARDVACARSAAGPVPVSPMHLLGHEPAEGDRDARLDLASGPREPFFGIAVSEQAERTAPLDDREDLEPPVLSHEVGDRGVTGLVRGDGLPVLLRVDHGLLRPISSLNFASITSSKFISRRPSRRATSSPSSNRCSIITGV